ncbi:MAG: isochorismate synthase [Bradymonadia bacterium]|jgi:isochorismate synthase
MMDLAHPRATTRADHVEQAQHELLTRLADADHQTRVAVRIPPLSMTGVLSRLGGDASLWLSSEGEACVGTCHTTVAEARGPNRFAALREGWRTAAAVNNSTSGCPAMRLFLGATFDDADYDDVWNGYGRAFLSAPAVSVERHDGQHWWVVAPVGDVGQRRYAIEEMRRAILESPPVPSANRTNDSLLVESGGTTREEHMALVDDALRRIGEQGASKIVAARRLDLRFDAAIDVPAVLQQLAFGYPNCARFAWRWNADGEWRTFLGATPERLVKINGKAVRSEALAGTASTQDVGAADALMNSVKDQAEHRAVVDHIRESLSPLCKSLKIGSAPELRALKNALHLRTGISGTLEDGVDVFDVLQRLHPTPAVGGVPVDAALRWIREREPTPRGGYAAPIGWVDANGDADVMVAIRSAVVRGDRAHLFAGGGIVAGSEAEGEWEETNLKLQAMLEPMRGEA